MNLAIVIQGLQDGHLSPGETIKGDIFDIVILSQTKLKLSFKNKPPEIWQRSTRLLVENQSGARLA